MLTQEAVEVVKRFYEAIDKLIEDGTLRGKQTFCNRYGLDKRNFYAYMKEPAKHNFNISWLLYLVNDYGISPRWLLTGKGKMR